MARSRQTLHVITALMFIAGTVVGFTTGGMPTSALAARPGRVDPGLHPAVESYTLNEVPATTTATTRAPLPTTTVPRVVPSPPPTTTPAAPASVAPPAVTTTTPTAPPTTMTPPRASAAFAPQLVARLGPAVVQVYGNPGDVQPVAALFGTTDFGNPTTLPVTQQGGDWLRVQLPLRPNGLEGWIHASDATLSSVDDSVVVDLAAHTLVWTHKGTVALSATVGIGAPTSPTPTGHFFVTDVLPNDPNGAYGAWVVALDAHSETFTEFEGGDARIAIHGTNDPSSIGAAKSFGCLRTDAVSLAALANGLPIGTPVEIR